MHSKINNLVLRIHHCRFKFQLKLRQYQKCLNLVSTAVISNRKSKSKFTMLVLYYTGLAYKRYKKISVKQQKDKNLAIVIIY